MAPDGSIVIESRVDNAQSEKELDRLTKKIESIEKEISGKQVEKSKWVQSAAELGVQLDTAKAKLYEMQNAAKGVFSAEQISMQKETVNSLQAQWNAAENQVEKYDRQIQSATEKLNQSKEQAAEIASQIAQAEKNQSKFGSSVDGTNKRFDKLLSRVSRLASRVFMFSVITSGLRAVRDWMGDVITSNDEASAALARLKGALLTMAQPLVSVVIPAFTTLVNLLTAVIGKIAAFISSISGKTVQESADAAKALNEQANAIGGVGSAAKEAQKQLMGFDEINKLSAETSAGGGGGGSASEADFGWTESVSDRLSKIADYVLLIGAGLALWKIGQLLPGALGEILSKLGLILIAIGSLLIAWDGIKDAWENGVNWGNMAEMILGVAGAAAALYLAFGSIAAGIVLVVGGIALLITGFHDAMENGWNLQNTLLSIAGIIAAGLGITLLTGSFIPLLIAAIAALLLAFTVATGHGEELINGLKKVCQGFVDFFTGVFSGDMELAISGIGSIFSGLGDVVGSVISGLEDTIMAFLDWLDEKTGGKLSFIIDLIKGKFSALFSGIKVLVSGTIDGIKQVFSGLVQFITGVFSSDFDMALDGIKNIVRGIANQVVAIINSLLSVAINGINSLFSALSFNISLPGGKSIGLSLPQFTAPQIPYLAQGAVIPPNAPFAAVLGDQKSGTNIEAPLSTIEQALRNVLAEQGNNGGDITIKFTGDLAQLARVLTPEIVRQTNRYNQARGV